MTDRVKNIVCAVSFLVFGVFVYYQASFIKPIMGRDLGSGFMPQVIAVAIIALAILALVLAVQSKVKESAKEDNDMKGGLLTILCIAAYVILYDNLGFLVSTFLYLFLQILILSNDQNRKISLFAVIALATSVIVYATFVYAIGMPLPEGILSF